MTIIAVDLEALHVSFDIHSRRVIWRVNDILWAMPASPLWSIACAGDVLTAQSAGVQFQDVEYQRDVSGMVTAVLTFVAPQHQLRIDWHVRCYDGTTLAEAWLVVTNQGAAVCTVTDIASVVLDFPAASYKMLSYSGGWGSEFEPHEQWLTGTVRLETRAGRSSQGMHPWCALWRDNRALIAVAVAWSGNWLITIAEQPDGAYRMRAGLNDWAFHVECAPGASVESAKVVLVAQDHADLNSASATYAQVGRAFWYPRSPLSDALPVEWNHWWTYEDRSLNEARFRANVDAAQSLGIEVCTLDAGWFGPSDPHTHWYDYRGDWHLVNTRRFPSGIRALSDYVHRAGMAFGIWCEIEAIGRSASINQSHPEIVARRFDASLGYVCLGSTAGWEWAFATLDRIISEYDADWIKLDFNLDPGAGCNRTDHGHGAGDGLLCHYQGYYRLLAAIRHKYPHVVLENCSSGGLRIDLGIARETHMAFLSDPDWPEHSLQLFWGASTMLAADALLHWGFCEWGFADHPQQTFDPRAQSLNCAQLDYYTHISMLHRFGFSQALPDLPDWVRHRYAKHIHDYKHVVRRFVQQGTLVRLTNQPRRDGTLDRFAGFQYVMPGAREMLVALFRLPGAKAQRRFYLDAINPDATYEVTWLDTAQTTRIDGATLRDGWLYAGAPEPGSSLFVLTQVS